MRPAAWVLAALLLAACSERETPPPGVDPIALDAVTAVEVHDFESGDLRGWERDKGTWTLVSEDGQGALLQSAEEHDFCILLAPAEPVVDVDLRVRFKSLAGKTDASGGLIFRHCEGRYYVLRANCLEHNFRLYRHVPGDRRVAAGTRVGLLERDEWHTLRVVARGPQVQGWIDGELVLETRVDDLRAGRVGLWTKADAVSAFDDFEVRR